MVNFLYLKEQGFIRRGVTTLFIKRIVVNSFCLREQEQITRWVRPSMPKLTRKYKGEVTPSVIEGIEVIRRLAIHVLNAQGRYRN